MASMMMQFIISDEKNDPHKWLQLMLELTSSLLPGTDVYKLYNHILSTCANPKRAYLHLSVIASLTDPLPILQISTLLGPWFGMDVQTTLIQLWSVLNIPTDNTLPMNIYHLSICNYVSNPLNCSLPQVCNIASPHSLLAHLSFHLMSEIRESSALLDAFSELKKQSQAMQPQDPHRLKDSLAFLIQPPEPVSVLIRMLWLQGDHRLDVQSWLETVDGSVWLQTHNGRTWLWTYCRKD
ncbi:uncharacterized protein BJ212DRAFT_1480808 [Suillus subaureus]|uniref:Uncharacterized protein n=1 Tax=Suillus subaureus TaxID=48587 RepID=A0A9P7EAU4_9AGAM|nr:uncharacterized protein BJ212DRAFT_1480808 [Suillus subaureus]KAG1816362.1 hypothetical protein BJ212DRAFT_1480808 [Suillus subaureus]